MLPHVPCWGVEAVVKVKECLERFKQAKRVLWEAQQADLYDYDEGSGNSLLSASPASRDAALVQARVNVERARDRLILALDEGGEPWSLDLIK